ncbi:MAG: hypothetical protein E6J01_03835 [Chloroflexi bacterium]|nr:MAG: hypothetical protein E6J01_03835 [Chloroflexota bacterium]
MSASPWIIMAISAFTDFLIAGGGTLMGGILESKAMPSGLVILVACLAGLVAAAKEVRMNLKLPEVPKPEVGKP